MTETARETFLVRFPGSGFPALRLPRGPHLSELLTPENSPVLFGCRTGICGTCLVSVAVLDGGRLASAAGDERELLDLLCPGRPDARLACQLDLAADIELMALSEVAVP
jgi:ferredoxin